jgi:nitrate/TMAO reductase-like tetraheme cytochrome c subunit
VRNRMGYFYNLWSAAGIILTVLGAGLLIVFMAVGAITGFASAYTGLLVYFAFPAMLVIGLLLIPIGVIQEKRRRARLKGMEIPQFPTIDFNETHQRRKFLFFVASTIGFLLILSIAVIQGYDYTESSAFCGRLCHTVMQPEYTAWKNSPHARVRCADCHIGPGAGWFVKTKLSGLRQVYKVLTHTWPTPIETPVQNLRPARETCEQCHWPQQFYSGRSKVFYYYASDKNNTPRQVTLLLKTGEVPMAPLTKGIHWHIGTEVYYQARDVKRQDIPYIRVREKNGSLTEYMDTENPLAKKEISKAKQRLMDCVDCHDRPTHIFRSPGQEMDDYFVSGLIDRSLPYIRKISIEILSKPYKSREEAFEAIPLAIKEYYRVNYPQISAGKAAEIDVAVDRVRDIYGRNFFPKMKTTWYTHVDNLGHFMYPGCFRCHDGKHKSSDGRVISKDCNLCHRVVGQKQENIPPGTVVSEFVHPVDIGDALTTINCSECHMPEGHK